MNKRKKKVQMGEKRIKSSISFHASVIYWIYVFCTYSIIWVTIISFQKYNVFTDTSTFVGIENYKKFFRILVRSLL